MRKSMIQITLSDTRILTVTFAHPTDFYLDEHDKSGEIRYTYCEIFELDEAGEPILKAEGVAKCAAGDNFQKRVGRKIALTRALKKMDLNKTERSMVWLRYLLRNVKPESMKV